jgi:mitogen-activated protein kinase kinase kinase
MQRSRRAMDGLGTKGGGLGMNNSLTGTPMYMSPEVIRNSQRGRSGAMDIWSMGCVVLECATGKKPWSNLDNEWCGKVVFTSNLCHVSEAACQGHHVPYRCRDPAPSAARTGATQRGRHQLPQGMSHHRPFQRPSAKDLMDSPWMLEFREALMSYEEVEMQTSPPVHVDENFDNASVARQAAIIHEQEIEAIRSISPTSPTGTPFESIPPLPL